MFNGMGIHLSKLQLFRVEDFSRKQGYQLRKMSRSEVKIIASNVSRNDFK